MLPSFTTYILKTPPLTDTTVIVLATPDHESENVPVFAVAVVDPAATKA